MKLYFAPLEGITTATYRNTHFEMFPECDAYYSPFINPSDQEKVSKKGMRDILPEVNSNINLKVQVLTNCADSFLKFADKIKPLGYDEININIGCPASTVVKKGRGSGFLLNPDSIDSFLCEIFEKSNLKISVKTRIGYYSADEFEEILTIYNKYPLSKLIVHPRTREQYYGGIADINAFSYAYNNTDIPLCYNGDIFTVSDFNIISEKFPNSDIMIGRGAVKNPAIFREITSGNKITTEELLIFTEKLIQNYSKILSSDTFTLHKIKEIWMYMIQNYPKEKKILKNIKKATKLSQFVSALEALPDLKEA